MAASGNALTPLLRIFLLWGHMRFKPVVLLLALPLLTGCLRFSLDTLKSTEPSGSAYSTALAVEYQAFAQSEADQFDWWDAEKFAKKGLRAANGEDVPPEDPNEWDIPKSSLFALLEAHQKLIELSTPEVRAKEPELAARAQAMFDCWVEQQEENWQNEHIDACRGEFFEVLDYFSTENKDAVNVNPSQFEEVAPENADEKITFDEKPKTKLAKAIADKPKTDESLPWKDQEETLPWQKDEVLPWMNAPQETDTEEVEASYVVLFNFNSFALTTDGYKVIDRVVSLLKKEEEGYEVILNGYSDTIGNAEYNLILSRRRADSVRDGLVKKGILRERIQLYSHGEDKLAVPTKDGVKEKSNRRVEIFIH